MKNQKIGNWLFWVGAIFAIAFAGIVGRSLYYNLRTLSADQLDTTLWALDKPIFMLWAFSITLGSLLAGIGAFVFVKTRKIISWITAFGVLTAVLVMNLVWSRVYSPTLFGIGGVVILVVFFAIVWVWMKRYAKAELPEKVGGSFKLIGYLFWINASWFLCGETGKLHLMAFEGAPVPSPIEIMVFLVLGWIFMLIGDYREMRLRSH